MNYEIVAEHTEPKREERKLIAPEWVLSGPLRGAIVDIAPDGQLYRHQSMGLEKLGQNSNLIISTGTASGKTLVFQLTTMDRLLKDKEATAVALYPLKALSRDQLTRWRKMTVQLGIDPESVQKIDGDVYPMDVRTDLLEKSRLALMTPDILHRWLLNYSDTRTSRTHPQVNRTKSACRKFIRNLAIIIIDEAHSYETAFGANMAYLIRRLRARRRELNPRAPEPLIIGASATILNPREHMELLTGLRFDEVTEADNGSPRSPLTVQHIAGRVQGMGSEIDMIMLIKELLEEGPEDTYIAFADDRQKVERIAAGIEPTGMMHEEDIINESELSMSYRAGLQARELIEDKLKSGNIRGLVSTSALEMGIDIPELTVGINLGLPTSIKRTKQRAGRVGRNRPGRFIIMEEHYAFQFEPEGLRGYWEREPEPAKLYLNNRFLQRIHAECLAEEQGRDKPIPDMNWPEGFTATAESGKKGEPYAPDTETLRGQDGPVKRQRPHEHDLRSFADKQFSVYIEGNDRAITEMTKVEAMRELYTWATYHHAKQAYRVSAWHEDGAGERSSPHVILQLAGDKERRTNRVMETGAAVVIEETEAAECEAGMLIYAGNRQATGIETITGCEHFERNNEGKRDWTEYRYADRNVPDITRKIPTTMTALVIEEEWFENPENREKVINALQDIMCHLDNIGPGDLMTAHENITLSENGVERAADAVALWDRAYGGMGLAKTLYDKLPEYAGRLLEVAEDPSRAPDSGLPLPLDIARNLKEWTNHLPAEGRVRPTPVRPIETTYKGVTFRSQLEARWAAEFDSREMKWEYEPASFMNWIPDFRIEIQGQETYAEVKPVNVAEKIDASAWTGQAMILGRSPEHRWIRQQSKWKPTT